MHLLSRVYYAFKNTWIPVLINLLFLIISVVVSVIYAEVYGILSSNLLNSVDYYLTWNNSYATSLNTIEGDPLQICTTDAARFLNTDIT